jgi:hypothetical protein
MPIAYTIDHAHRLVMATGHGEKQLAELSASMDPAAMQSKFAIVAPGDYTYGLGRM